MTDREALLEILKRKGLNPRDPVDWGIARIWKMLEDDGFYYQNRPPPPPEPKPI